MSFDTVILPRLSSLVKKGRFFVNKKEIAKESFKEFLKNYPLTPEDKIGELWTWIESFEQMYQVSNFGRVRSFHQGEPTIMQPVLGKDGYLIVNLSKSGTKKQFLIHRLVVKYFVANPENKHEIHHIDFNKFNNRYDNLMPVTRGEHRKLEREHAMKLAGVEPPEIPLVVQIFEDKQFGDIRYLEIEGDFWFVAADVCRILEIQNPRDAVAKGLGEDEKADVDIIYTSSNGAKEKRKVNIVNEPGLYRLIFKSRTKEAKKFQRKVYHEILPSIRKTGEYHLPSKESKPGKTNFSPNKKVKLLDKYIDIAVDDNLRDYLIFKAALLI